MQAAICITSNIMDTSTGRYLLEMKCWSEETM